LKKVKLLKQPPMIKTNLLILKVIFMQAMPGFCQAFLFPLQNKVFRTRKSGKPSCENQGNPDFLQSIRLIF
jgi:hypothetical protein